MIFSIKKQLLLPLLMVLAFSKSGFTLDEDMQREEPSLPQQQSIVSTEKPTSFWKREIFLGLNGQKLAAIGVGVAAAVVIPLMTYALTPPSPPSLDEQYSNLYFPNGEPQWIGNRPEHTYHVQFENGDCFAACGHVQSSKSSYTCFSGAVYDLAGNLLEASKNLCLQIMDNSPRIENKITLCPLPLITRDPNYKPCTSMPLHSDIHHMSVFNYTLPLP